MWKNLYRTKKAYNSVLTVFLYKGDPLVLRAPIPETMDMQLPVLQFQEWFEKASRDSDKFTFSDDEVVVCVKFGAISHYSIKTEEVM